VIVLECLPGPGNMWSYRLGKDMFKTREGGGNLDSKDISALLGCAATRPTNFPVLSSFQRQQPELCSIGTLPFSSRPPVPCYSFFGSGRCIPPALTPLPTPNPPSGTCPGHWVYPCSITVSLFLQQTMDHGYIGNRSAHVTFITWFG